MIYYKKTDLLQSVSLKNNKTEETMKKQIWTIALLAIFPPVGILLTWLLMKDWGQPIKIIATVISGIWLIIALIFSPGVPLLVVIPPIGVLLTYLWVENKSKKSKTVVCVICAVVLVIALIMSFFGGSTPREPIETTQTVLENIELRGVDENTVPLAVTDLMLTHIEHRRGEEITQSYFTLSATLLKLSETPEGGFFEFNVILIDESGVRIAEQSVDTMPNAYNSDALFTYQSTSNLDVRITPLSNDRLPVAVEFVDIVEVDKAEFIRITLDDTKDRIDRQNFSDARRLLDLVLRYDPDNAEVQELLAQIELLEQEAATTTEEPATAEPQAEDDPFPDYVLATRSNIFAGIHIYERNENPEHDSDVPTIVVAFGNEGLMENYIFVNVGGHEYWTSLNQFIEISEYMQREQGIMSIIRKDDPALERAERTTRATEADNFRRIIIEGSDSDISLTALAMNGPLAVYVWNSMDGSISRGGTVVERVSSLQVLFSDINLAVSEEPINVIFNNFVVRR